MFFPYSLLLTPDLYLTEEAVFSILTPSFKSRSLLGDRPMAGQQSLDLLIGVRIPVPQPISQVFSADFVPNSNIILPYSENCQPVTKWVAV